MSHRRFGEIPILAEWL